MPGYFGLIERWRYRFLLAVLLAAILLEPLLQGSVSGQAFQILVYGDDQKVIVKIFQRLEQQIDLVGGAGQRQTDAR